MMFPLFSQPKADQACRRCSQRPVEGRISGTLSLSAALVLALAFTCTDSAPGQTLPPIPPVATGPGYQTYALTSNEMAIFPQQPSLAANWSTDRPTTSDISFAQANWGSLVAGLPSPTAKAQALAEALINALEPHRGVPSSVMGTLSPFDQYRRAVAGGDYVWCTNIAAIFRRACACFGIPSRILGIGNEQTSGGNYVLDLAPGHASTEIYDASLERWIWIDPTFYMLGVHLTGGGLINAAELQRCLNDPAKINLLTSTEYSPITRLATTGPIVSSDQVSDLEWYFSPITIFELYSKSSLAVAGGAPSYLNSNENDLFPRDDDLNVESIKGLTSQVGISVQVSTGIVKQTAIGCQQTYSSAGPLLSAALESSTNGLFNLGFGAPDSASAQASVYKFSAIEDGTDVPLEASMTIFYYSPEFYAAYNQVNPGVFIVDTEGLSYWTSQVGDWIVDDPSTADTAFAEAKWGGLVSAVTSPTQQVQALAEALLSQLQAHRGASLTPSGLSPFAAYRAAVAGQVHVGDDDLAAIFAHACNCLGIPARVVGSGLGVGAGPSTDEVFDSALNQWEWLDLGDNIVGVSEEGYGPVSSAEILRCADYPERLPALTVTSFDPTSKTLSSAPASATGPLAILLDFFDGTRPLLYNKKAAPIAGTAIPGDFNGDGKTDLLVQDGQGVALYTATGSPSQPFAVKWLWSPGVAYGGWGDPGATITPGDFNGDGKTDFIIHDDRFASLFTATGIPATPFTHQALWNPAYDPDGWSAEGPVNIIPGNFNGDGMTDFIVQNSRQVALYTATGKSGHPFNVTWLWTPGAAYGNWGDPGAVITPGDFNGDGKTDFIIHDARFASLFTATGNLASPFTHQALWNPAYNPDGWATAAQVTIIPGNFSGNGKTDFMVQGSGRVALYTATGNSAHPFTATWLWTPGVAYGNWGDATAEITPGDFNGDGKTEFIIHNGQYASLFMGTGNPSSPFTHQALWNPTSDPYGWSASGPVMITAGKFLGDGKTEFFAQSRLNSALYVSAGTSGGPFTPIWFVASPPP